MVVKPSFLPSFLSCALLTALLVGCAQTPPTTLQQHSPDAVVPSHAEPPLLAPPPPQALALRADSPQRYTIQPGDNLWDVAGTFLDDPWRWRELWRASAGIDGPAKLYPGDTVEVYYEDEQPQMRLTEGERPTVKLSPRVRVEYVTQAIPTVPREAVQPFLSKSLVLSEDEIDAAPYVVGTPDGRRVAGPGNTLFVRGAEFDPGIYRVYRPGGEYRDPASGESLGFAMVYVGEAELAEDDDPAVFQLTNARQESRPGDRILPAPSEVDLLGLVPRPASDDVLGNVIETLQYDRSVFGHFINVAVSVGEVDGVEPGHVLAVYGVARDLEDPLTGEDLSTGEERIGLVMLYKVFDFVSLGLVTESEREIRVNDVVRGP